MRETSTAMEFLLELLNVNFESTSQRELRKIEALRERGSHYKDREMALAQSLLKGQIAFITEPEDANRFAKRSIPGKRLLQNVLDSLTNDLSPIGSNAQSEKLRELVEDLNDWAENTAPDAKGIHPRWRVRSAEKARGRMEPGQAVLKLGQYKYVVDDWFIIHNFQDQVNACVARCLKTGELGRLRKCPWCSGYFFAGHFRQKFCCPEHQIKSDRKAAPLRVKRSRMKARKRRFQHDRDAKEAASVKAFEKYLKKVSGKLADQESVGKLTRKIGGWKTVNRLLQQYKKGRDAKEVWSNLSQQHKDCFADYIEVEQNLVY
jgi:hypothetical protein